MVLREFSSFDGTLFRNSLAYSFLLALFPTLIVIVMLFQNSVLDIDPILNSLYRYLPESLIAPFVSYIMKRTYQGVITIVVSLIIAFYLASKSIYSFMIISAKYENFNVPKILIRIKSYVLFVFLVLSILIIGTFISFWVHSYKVIIPMGLFVVLYVFYRVLTFEIRDMSYGLLGASVVTLMLLLLGNLFLSVVSTFFSYDNLYGPMASLLISLLSIYLVSSSIYFGYCLNLVYGKTKDVIEYKHERAYLFGKDAIEKVKKWIKKIVLR